MQPLDETRSGSHLPANPELVTVADCSDYGRRGFGTNATDARDALTGRVRPKGSTVLPHDITDQYTGNDQSHRGLCGLQQRFAKKDQI